MHILLTNDDGIYSDGLRALHRELSALGRVTVVAPDSERSSVGHGITLAQPLYYKTVRRNGKVFGYGISGTPADCVKIGVSVILKKRKPDLIVSGINLGDNDGSSVHYSGTVAAAREGALSGIPSMAISLASFTEADFGPAARISQKLVRWLYRQRKVLPEGTFFNVNIPARPLSRIRGIRLTRQGTEPIHATFHKRVNPNDRKYFWMSGKFPVKRKDLTVDTHALHGDYVAVTPIKCDSTDFAVLAKMQNWDLSL